MIMSQIIMLKKFWAGVKSKRSTALFSSHLYKRHIVNGSLPLYKTNK